MEPGSADNRIIQPIRRPNGQLLPGPGAALNPAGRPVSQIAALREQFGKRLPEFFARLIELSHSNNETIALQACREILDRLIGKPVAVVESTHTRVDVAALYLQALQQANQPKVIEPSEPKTQD